VVLGFGKRRIDEHKDAAMPRQHAIPPPARRSAAALPDIQMELPNSQIP